MALFKWYGFVVIIVFYSIVTSLVILFYYNYKKSSRKYKDNRGYVEGEPVLMRDVLGDYIETIVAEKENIIAEKDNVIAKQDNVIAEKEKVIADINTRVVTYLVEQNKTNEEIKKILPTVDDDFINSIRNAD